MSLPPSRPQCYRCLKAARACLCHVGKPFSCSIQFVILMHRKEQRDRLGTGTGRLTHLCIENSRLFVGLKFEAEPELENLLKNPALFPCVLAPGELPLDVGTQDGRKSFETLLRDKTAVVFVLDGSWTGAAKILEHNPRLAALPRVSFSTGRRSRYGFKKQPREECLSTLEAVHELIDLLERAHVAQVSPPQGHHTLLEVFDSMVAFQRAFSPPTRLASQKNPAP